MSAKLAIKSFSILEFLHLCSWEHNVQSLLLHG